MHLKKHIAALAATTAFGLSAEAPAAIYHYSVALTGTQQVDALGNPNGDPNGFGVADLLIDDTTLTVSWSLTVAKINRAITGAHIHQGVVGQPGPVVVDFSAAMTGSGLYDLDLANVIANPQNFYIGVHNTKFPLGALRGQIGSPLDVHPVPLPAAAWLLGSGLLGLVGVARRKSVSASTQPV